MTGIGASAEFERDGRSWPHRESSRFLSAGPCHWHVQITGAEDAPVMLLLHGTGASSHSWRHLVEPLGQRFRLVIPDLPGHGFTRPTGHADLSLPGMARAIESLMDALDLRPDVIIGHSAGAAIAVALGANPPASWSARPGHIIGINGAFLPIRGNKLLSPMAKLLFANPFSASMFSALSRTTSIGDRLLASTRSRIDSAGAALYRQLLTSSAHVRGALGMMASWNLDDFDQLLGQLDRPLTLIAALDDPMVPAGNSSHASTRARQGQLQLAPKGGHLLHESEPDLVARIILDATLETIETGMTAA